MDTRTAELLLAALNVEKANINTYKTQLGFTNVEVTESEQDYGNLAAAIGNVAVADADKQSVTKVKNAVYNGDENESIQPYPTFTLTALPFPDVKAGVLTRYNRRKGKGRLSANYTQQIGVAMSYEGTASEQISPSDVKPSVQAFAALIGYLFSLVVLNRAGATMWEVQIQRKGSDVWQTIASATGKSTDITITPTTPGQAEQILVRVILKKNNQSYGQPSDPVYVTLNP